MENSEIYTPALSLSRAENLYDLSMLEEMDDTEYLLEILTVLLNETPKDFKAMKEALQAGKTDIVCKQAHKLKSSAGIIQAEKLATILENIETIGKKGSISKELSDLIANAAYQYSCIEKELKNYTAALSN